VNRLPIVTIDGIEKIYNAGQTAALRGVSFTVEARDFIALMGPSGCGKSTLLHLIGGMDRPTRGSISLDGVQLQILDDDQLARIRRTRIGFVFQFFNLLPTLTVVENVALPLLLDGLREREAHSRARLLVDRVGMAARASHFPSELSGGEMQRAAVARALVVQPQLVLADEPTGNLDSQNGEQVMKLLNEVNRELGVTIILATHSNEAASYGRRTIYLRDGRIEHQTEAGA
jgi:putative ABC transport system ATP-binding protein